ncbi:helix-turn-helix transcriptional regulator [Streptomyces sp. VRA16 Mangrove soil]|uniref:helix-turn-helix domain-containing protein n=1 Tax=Streptomyces sp. VRA16 Mangrove soil TaxID=2817434 RepID=UPI001A9F058D|nr:helix-turn-helix transcriptional regulator [Streptomyces sp. VRA16 Mangrove soil]MBO1331377.1 helix-turn-helix transcriptional regulator [Streptomyces sp. VRA16 Mangrove soil]
MADRHGDAARPREHTNPWDELTAEMKRIKDTTNLSYATLARRTHYSRSSWERFLNQKQLPTRVAIEQFAAAAEQDVQPLLARFEQCLAHVEAERGSSRHPADAGQCGAGSPAGCSGHLSGAQLRALALASAAGAVLGSLLTLAAARPRPVRQRRGATV